MERNTRERPQHAILSDFRNAWRGMDPTMRSRALHWAYDEGLSVDFALGMEITREGRPARRKRSVDLRAYIADLRENTRAMRTSGYTSPETVARRLDNAGH